MNRNMGRIVALDYDSRLFDQQPDNLVSMDIWEPGKNDQDLLAMLPFLEGLDFTTLNKFIHNILCDFFNSSCIK